MKKNAIFLFVFLFSFLAKGATYSLNSLVEGTDPSTLDYIIRDADGVNLSSGYVGVGVFASVSDAEVSGSSFFTLSDDFVAFGSDDFVAGATNAYGAASPGVTALSGSFSPSSYIGKNIYIFIGNGETLADSTQFAVLLTTEQVNSDSPTPDANVLRFATSTPIYGSYSAGTYDGTPYGLDSSVSAQAVNLVAVPEPSAALLGGLSALALLRRRRVA